MITRSHNRRRAGLIVAGVLAMVLGLASSSQARELVGPQATVARPNILVVVTDDQRIGTVTPEIMPNVYSQLVQHGVSFDNGFVTNSWCCPSRASILTGQYSHTNGVWTTGGPLALPARRKHENDTLATWLRSAGYRTALIGKYLNGYGATASTTFAPPGWDVTDIIMDIDYHGNDGYYNYDTFQNGRIVHYGTAPDDYSTRVFTKKVRQFFASDPTDTRPKFAYLAYPSPHGPYTDDPLDTNALSGLSVKQPPNICEADVSDKPLFVRQQPACTSSDSLYSSHLRSQGRMLVSVDRGLGQLFGDLTRTGQIKNTIIIYISDNGWLMKAHRLTGKELPYEESIRVPFLFRWDALGRSNIRLGQFALNIDIAPTITSAIGLTTHDKYDGSSLLPIIKGTATSWRKDFLVEHLQGWPADPGGPSFCAVRNSHYKYVEYATGEKELYDLVNDPYELTNRAGSASLATVQASLRNRLLTLCNPPPPGWTP